MKISKLRNKKYLILRKSTVCDAKDIIDYLNCVGGESDYLLFGKDEFILNVEEEKLYLKKINKDSDSLMLLGIIDGEIISVSQVYNVEGERIKHNCEIAISVKKKYWRNGIGTIIMKELIDFAKEKNKKNICLTVNGSNHQAIKMYEKFGFKKIGENKEYYKVNNKFYNRILMDLSI
ncbi:MAG: GNAT family N-acetyltransferase [Clostridium perfringens]|nr:GNAT family N-acetyltransferase [Clostridium perfringens]